MQDREGSASALPLNPDHPIYSTVFENTLPPESAYHLLPRGIFITKLKLIHICIMIIEKGY